jgi:hypothetical protein
LVAAEERAKAKRSRKRLPLSKKTTVNCGKETKKSAESATHFSDDSDDDDNDDDAQCLYCQDWYSKSTEEWIVCFRCHKWTQFMCRYR